MTAEAEAVTKGGVGAAAVIAGSAELGDEIVPAAGDLFERLTNPLPGGAEDGVSGREWQRPGKSRYQQGDDDPANQEARSRAARIRQLGPRPLDLSPVGRVAGREHRAGHHHDE